MRQEIRILSVILVAACGGGTQPLAMCGNNDVEAGEQCDDGNSNSLDGCLYDCRTATCGDRFVQTGVEECDDGADNSDTRPGACRTNCTRGDCGNGRIDPGEVCDDGELNSDTEPNACRETCHPAGCGDGVVDEGEECDETSVGCVECFHIGMCTPGCEVEPNDVFSDADDFDALAVGGRIDAYIDPPGDQDIFRVVVPEGPKVTLSVATVDGREGSTCADLQIDNIIEIWDARSPADGVLLASDDDDGIGFCAYARKTALLAGNYEIVVRGFPFLGTTFDYGLIVTLTPLGLELEPNDTVVTAQGPIPEDDFLEGAISVVGDADIYAITVPATADLYATTWDASGPENCSGVSHGLELKAPSGDFIAQDIMGGTGGCARLDSATTPALRKLPPGIYYLRVHEAQDDSTAPYILNWRFNALCGDGLLQGFEACDDGDLEGGDGCSPSCDIE